MSSSLQQAVHAALPILQELHAGFGRPSTATTDLLAQLSELARSSPTAPSRPVPAPTSAPQAAATEPATWTMDTLRAAALVCVKCPNLVVSRTQVVFGVGNESAELMFVGEAPGADEDLEGEPFVGKAGQLLTKIIQAMGFAREDVYIANVLKCRPDMPAGMTGNRKPRPEEMATCLPWLKEQIALVRPRVIVALGATALEGLLNSNTPVSKMRGKWLEFQNIPVMATYHPAYLLRNQAISEKRKVWEDMLQVLQHLGRPVTEKQQRFFTQGA